MSYFEFLMIMAGIVVAVAMTEIVSGLGRLIQTRRQVSHDWLHLGWSFVALIISMLYWHGMWPYQNSEFTHIYQIWLLVLPTLSLVVVAFALSPNTEGVGELVVREYYLAKRRPIFLGFAAFIAMAWVADFAITKKLLYSDSSFSVGLIVVFVLLAFSSRIWVHTTFLVLVALFFSSAGFQEVSEAFSRFDV